MKNLRFLILGLLAVMMVCPSASRAGVAETITPEIQSLAQGLQNDPKRIFDFVHDHIRYQAYFGAKKGAEGTLLDRSGSDFDQCALLVALLNAAGYTNLYYESDFVIVPYQSTNHQDFQHLTGISKPNTNWNESFYFAAWMLDGNGGFPSFDSLPGDNNDLVFQHVWIQANLNGTNYALDPSFKVSEPVAGLDVGAAVGMSAGDLLSAAGGTNTADYVQSLNEAAVRAKLAGYTTNLLAYLQSNDPNASVDQIMGGQQIVSSASQPLGQTWNFQPGVYDSYIDSNYGGYPNYYDIYPLTWTAIPADHMSTLTVTLDQTNQLFYMPGLAGQRLSLTFNTNGLAQLWLEDQEVLEEQTTGTVSTTSVNLYVDHPHGQWNYYYNSLVNEHIDSEGGTAIYARTNASYVLLYAFDPDPVWLRERQEKLDAYRSAGLPDSSRAVQTETLNVMGLTWLVETELSEQALARQGGMIPMHQHRVGRMAEVGGASYFVDVYLQLSSPWPVAAVANGSGLSAADESRKNQAFDLESYFSSAAEHGVIEQMQSSNLVAASTVKLLQLANAGGQKIFLASPNNWASGENVSSQLVNYDQNYLYALLTNTVNPSVAQTNFLLLPLNGSNSLAGAGSWSGFGIVDVEAGAAFRNDYMLISGGFSGGYPAFPVSLNTPFISLLAASQSPFFYPGDAFLWSATAGDPVRMLDGALQISSTDLTLGQHEPRGIGFTRYYSPTRRYHNQTGLGNGWTHSYNFNLATVSAPLPGSGTTTPAQMASMLVATRAALALYQSQPDPKNWLTTVLIAKWGIDQLINNSVSVTLGNDAVQFIKQPDGSFTPPAACTMTLAGSNGVFTLQQRHGDTFHFSTNGVPSSISDPYGQSLSLSYTSNLLQTVTDWKSRTLTFNYSGGLLSSVADSAGRSVGFGHSGTDLTSVTDPESKTRTFGYDTNHQVTGIFNALNQLVVSNLYDGFGRVVTQYTQGDANKTWRYFWSGWENVMQDPAGGQQTYFYDDQSRLVAQQDAFGNLSQTFYDGQDHAVMTISPLNETNQFFFDGNHNVIQTIDPLGFTNRFFYDGQNNLITSVDPRGNPSTFGYNGQFSLTGQTNGAGDWVNYAYNSDGTLHTRTDSGGQTTYDTYDGYGQLTHITYPGSLGGESFANSSLGDVTSHTDARGFATSFGYNSRRELTNSVAPTNLTVKVSFDAVGNVAGTTDARGNVTSNTWSVTRHLLATTFPATPQGVPVMTNAYDSRDWLTRTVDPLQHATTFTNDLAGRLIAATDPVLRTTTLGYDADSRKIAATNAAQEVTSQTWDARGGLLQLTDGAGHFSTRAYDAAGNQIILTNRNGKKWQFQFDGANRLTNTITPLNRSTSLAFNHQGLVSYTKDPASQPTSLYYDAKGRLTNRTDNVATTLFGFDANNNRTSVTENGNTNTWTFDAYNRVSSYKDILGNLIQYKYDANGNLTNLVYPGGKNVYYAFDSLNRMTNVTDWSGRKTSIGYDLASHITSIVRPNGSYRTIGYDAAGQATNILEQMGNSLPIAWFRLNWTNSGSMGWEFAAPLPHSTTVPTRTMTYDDDNRLATFNGSSVSSDSDGNLTSAPLTNSTFVSYAFDARNRLLNAGGVTNAYDAMNNRIGQTLGTNITTFVVNPNATLPQVLMRIKNGVTNYYIYGAGLLYQITETATATNTLTYHFDYRGSTIALSADNGLVTDRMEYSAYGLTTYRTGTSDTPFLFNGRYGVQTDANGLLYMRARYYNPYLCRFVSADPSGFGGGLNYYAYANGNPVSLLDPFGLGALGENSISWSWVNLGGANTVANVTYPYNIPWYQSDSATRQWLPETIGPIPPDPFTYDALVIGNGVGDINSPSLQGSAQINSTAYNMFLPLRGPGSSGAAVTTFSEPMIVSVEEGYVGVDGGILAARNAALNNLNAAQQIVGQTTDLVEGAMQAVNNASQAGNNSAQMLQANQALQAAYQAQNIALRNALAAQEQWESINSAAVNGVRLLPP